MQFRHAHAIECGVAMLAFAIASRAKHPSFWYDVGITIA
jgi:hypothetical protein